MYETHACYRPFQGSLRAARQQEQSQDLFRLRSNPVHLVERLHPFQRVQAMEQDFDVLSRARKEQDAKLPQ